MAQQKSQRGQAQQGVLDALQSLKGQVRSAPPRKTMAAERRAVRSSESPQDEDQSLWQQSQAGVQALKPVNRAELGSAKPSARPRPPQPDSEVPAPMARAPDTVLGLAYQDVTPIKDSGRVDMSDYRRPQISPPEPLVVSKPVTTFEQAVMGAVPLANTGRLHIKPEPPPAIPRQRLLNEQAVLRESLDAPISFEDRLDMGDEPAFSRPGIPRRVLSDLRRGRWVVQGELDLHGLTREQARLALGQFLNYSLREGKRCLRLIHGQGHGSPGREPVLKHLSKNWLAQRDEILAFCQARPHEGGAGALLILLKAGQRAGPAR